MKNNMKFALLIVLLLGVAFAIEYSLPKSFNWNPTFNRHDKEPLGSYVFDDILSTSLKNGYSVTNETFYQLASDSSNQLRSFLDINQYSSYTPLEVNTLLDLAKEGNNVMLISSSFSYKLLDSLKINHDAFYFSIDYVRYQTKAFRGEAKRDSLILLDSLFSSSVYTYYPTFITGYFSDKKNNYRRQFAEIEEDEYEDEEYEDYEEEEEIIIIIPDENLRAKSDTVPTWADSLDIRVLAQNSYQRPVALEIDMGKGKLFMIANPLIFTNYGMLDQDNAGYVMSILSYIDEYPVIRMEPVNARTYSYSEESQTPFRYFLSHPPLKWSLYLLFLSIILLMIVAAKRKQRIIPVITPPANKTAEFAELIGTLYFQRRDYTDLTRKKYIYFVDQLKRNTYIDIEAEEVTPELCERLSAKTGMDATLLYQNLKMIQSIKEEGKKVDETEMKQYINQMNEILINSR